MRTRAAKRIMQLFIELDGSDYGKDPNATLACVAALLQRIAKPPEDNDPPTKEDITRSAHALSRMVEDEAEHVRRMIRREN